MKGRMISGSATFYPDEHTAIGDEWVGTYEGLKDYEYKGQPRKAALFHRDEDVVQISGGQMVKMLAPNLTEGQKYFVRYDGKKDMGNGGNAAHQFTVWADEKDKEVANPA